MAQPTHRHDVAHRGLVPVSQLASGVATSGMVPAYAGTLNAVWTALSALGALTNPMTTQDDVIVGGAVTGGVAAPARLGKGTDGQVLTVDPTTHHLTWATPDPIVQGFAIPSINLDSTASVGGINPLTIYADATIKAFDTTAPSTQAFGDAAAVGSAAFAARRDHKHAMPSDHPLGMMGTAFPTGAALTAYLALYGANAPFYRTDLGESYYYDGTLWLSCVTRYLTFKGTRPSVSSSVVKDSIAPVPPDSPNIYLRTMRVNFNAAGIDPNNYWAFTLAYYTNNTRTYLSGVGSTIGATAGTETITETAINAAVSGATMFEIELDKTLAPGAVRYDAVIPYLKIAT